MRISKKTVLEYLESVYPAWKNFEQIMDGLPVMFNYDVFELQDRIDSLCATGKIEKEFPDYAISKGEWQHYRFINKEKRK